MKRLLLGTILMISATTSFADFGRIEKGSISQISAIEIDKVCITTVDETMKANNEATGRFEVSLVSGLRFHITHGLKRSSLCEDIKSDIKDVLERKAFALMKINEGDVEVRFKRRKKTCFAQVVDVLVSETNEGILKGNTVVVPCP